MSKKEQDILGLSEEQKEIYFLLLRKSPLTIGELCFLSKKSEDKIKSNLKLLTDLELTRLIEDTIPLYIANYPTLLLKENLDNFAKNLNEFESNFKTKNKSDLETVYQSLAEFKSNFQKNSETTLENYLTTHSLSIQELDNESKTIVKNQEETIKETLKEVSNDFSEQRAKSTNSLNVFSESMNTFFDNTNSKFALLIENLQGLTTQNKKLLKKSITDTIKSLDEGAKLLGKNVNDQLKNFEGKLIDSINSSISVTVDISNSFKNQLIEDYSIWRTENNEFINNLENKNDKLISDTVTTNLSIVNDSSSKIIEKLQYILDEFNKNSNELSKRTSRISEERTTLFLQEIESHTENVTTFFGSLKDEMDTNAKIYQNSIEEYEKSITNEIKTFLGTSLQDFEENFKFLSQILSEFINNARNSFDKEYLQIINDNNDILDRIVEIISSLKNNYENQLTDLQNNVDSLENSFKDLTVAIKRRFDKFSTEASSLLNSVGNKIIDELLNIQGSSIELIEQQKLLKQNFTNVIKVFNEKNDKTIDKSKSDVDELSKNLLTKKLFQLSEIEKEIKDYSSFINERHAILDNQLKTKNEEFINEFRTALAKIREDAQVIIQTEQTEYLSSLTDINSNSDILLNQQKDTIVEVLDTISLSLSKSIQEAIDTITQTFTKLKNSIVNDIVQHKTSFSQTFDTINKNVDDISTNYINNYKNVLESSVNSLKNVEVTYWSKFEDTFSKNKEKVLEIYKTNTDSLQGKTNAVVRSLNGFLDEIVESFSGINTEIKSVLMDFSSEMSEKLSEIQESADSQFQIFGDLSETLDQISQKSKLEIENELLDIETEMKAVTEKNFESYSQVMASTSAQLAKTLSNLSEASVEQINNFEKENLDVIHNLKEEVDQNREGHISNLANLSKESLNELNNRSSKQISVIKESKIQLEEKAIILAESLKNQLTDFQSSYQSKIILQFDEIIDTIPQQLKDYIVDFKASTKELFESLNQSIFNSINDSIADSSLLLKNSQGENQKNVQQSLNQLKTKFSEQIFELKEEFLETSKLRLEEIEIQINKELEIFSSKLVKKENDDVRKLRELIQSFSSVGIFNELINENLIANIDPLKNNIDNSIGNFQTEFEKLLHESNITSLDDLRQKTIQEFNDLLIDSYNASISKLNNIQKSFTDQLKTFQDNLNLFLEKTIESTKTKEASLLESSGKQFLTIIQNEERDITKIMETMLNSFTSQQEKLNKLVVDYNSLFNSIHSVLSSPDKETDSLYKSRIINVSEDVYKYLEDIISKTDKRIDLIIPSPENLDFKSIINLHTRVRIKIVINNHSKSDKGEKRKSWVHDLYKKKANVQLYDSTSISDLIICVRDNNEVLIVSEKKKSELTPGFIIQNSLFADYFAKSIVNNIILSATPITRENQK